MIRDRSQPTDDAPIVNDIVTLVSIIFFLVGIVFIGVAIYLYYISWLFTSSICINIGTGLGTASVTAMLFERFSRQAMRNVQQQIADQAIARIDENMIGEYGLKTQLQSEIRRGAEVTGIIVNEVLRSVFTEDIKKYVFNSGISGAFSAWSGTIPDDFLSSQTSADIFLKDGNTLFRRRAELLKQRFRRINQTTRLMIVHPDYERIDVIAAMDPYKNTAIQRNECLSAIQNMHSIRTQLLSEGIDIRNSVAFLGYRAVPTWNGYIGESFAYIHLYFTRSYRGDLNTLFIAEKNSNGKISGWYDSYKLDFEEIMRATQHSVGHDLWDYDLNSSKSE